MPPALFDVEPVAALPVETQAALAAHAFRHSPAVLYIVVATAGGDHPVRFVSPNVEAVTGHPPEAFLCGPDYGRRHIHPDDRPAYLAALRTALRATDDEEAAEVVYRLRSGCGDDLWVRDSLRRLGRSGEEKGDGAWIVGCMLDITAAKRAEVALRDAQAVHAAIVDASPHCIVAVDEGGRVVDLNPTAERTFGYGRVAAVGRPLEELIVAKPGRHQRGEGLRRYVETAWRGALGRRMEMEARSADGGAFPVELTVTQVPLQGRTIFLLDLRDLSEQRAADRERQRLLQLLRDAIESIANGFALYDADERLVLCNTAFASLYGETPDAMVGLSLDEMSRRAVPLMERLDSEPVNDPPTAEVERVLARAREASGRPIEAKTRDGCWLLLSSHRTTDGGLVFIRSDITDQKRAEASLRASERHFRQIVEGHPLPVWLVEAESGRIVYESPAAAALLGREWRAPGAASVTDYYVNPGDRTEFLRRLREHGAVRDFEVEFKRADGTRFWVAANSRLIVHEGRELVMTANVDLTERKQREAELRRARETLEDALESLSEGFALFDPDDRLVICNSRYREFNSRIADLLAPGVRWGDLLRAGAERGQYACPIANIDEWVQERLSNRFDAGKHEVPQTDGRWFQISRQRTRQGGTTVIRTEITHLKEMEKALRESEERFRGIAEAHPVPVVIVRVGDGAVLYASPAAAKLWGRPQAEIVGSSVLDYYVDPKERERGQHLFREQGHLESYEVRQRAADGSVIPVALTARRIVYDGHEAIVSGIYDLRERKAAEQELARQREALYRSEKLNALGALLAGVAHELNNPLSVVVGQALLLRETASDPTLAKRAERIGNAADRCARIVKMFLAMARQHPPEYAEVDVHSVIESALEITGYALRSADIEVVKDLAPELPPVWADADQLNQVFTNLIVNAQQAMLGVAARPRRLKIASAFDPARKAVRVRIADSGPGVPAELRARIFDPFFTTKADGAGTGVGLAVSRGIVQAHRGTIEVDEGGPSRGGAAFVVALPVASSRVRSADTAPSGSRQRERAAPACRVLVIDDEPDILQTLAEVLAGDGHEVQTAASGEAARELLERCDFDAVLSDLRMPGLDGQGLYRLLKKERPRLVPRLAFITGDTLGPGVRGFLEETGLPCLEKPYTPDEVRQVVRRLTSGKGRAVRPTAARAAERAPPLSALPPDRRRQVR